MSGIGRCPRAQYLDFLNGQVPDLRRDKYGHRGYLFEGDAKKRLERIKLYVPGSEIEVVAPFDKRFRGNTDGATKSESPKQLLELKSTGPDKFEQIAETNSPLKENLCQIQTYMHYSDFEECVLVYINADTFDHWIIIVPRDDQVGERMEARAKALLDRIDRRQPPTCTCGWCRR